jgi:hypothetical protein
MSWSNAGARSRARLRAAANASGGERERTLNARLAQREAERIRTARRTPTPLRAARTRLLQRAKSDGGSSDPTTPATNRPRPLAKERGR